MFSQDEMLGSVGPDRPSPDPCVTASPLGWPYGLGGAEARCECEFKLRDEAPWRPNEVAEDDATIACAWKSRAS